MDWLSIAFADPIYRQCLTLVPVVVLKSLKMTKNGQLARYSILTSLQQVPWRETCASSEKTDPPWLEVQPQGTQSAYQRIAQDHEWHIGKNGRS
jgi:hypothetical protein